MPSAPPSLMKSPVPMSCVSLTAHSPSLVYKTQDAPRASSFGLPVLALCRSPSCRQGAPAGSREEGMPSPGTQPASEGAMPQGPPGAGWEGARGSCEHTSLRDSHGPPGLLWLRALQPLWTQPLYERAWASGGPCSCWPHSRASACKPRSPGSQLCVLSNTCASGTRPDPCRTHQWRELTQTCGPVSAPWGMVVLRVNTDTGAFNDGGAWALPGVGCVINPQRHDFSTLLK